MPIINEIDEENPKNSRTIDTDTGVYLKLDFHHLRERLYGLSLYEKDVKVMEIQSTLSTSINEEKKMAFNHHFIGVVVFLSRGNQKKYVSLIEKLLKIHGRNFMFNNRYSQYKEHTQISFINNTDEIIRKWESEK